MALREDSGVRLATVGESRLVANSTPKYTVAEGVLLHQKIPCFTLTTASKTRLRSPAASVA